LCCGWARDLRLVLRPDGTVVYRLKRPFRDGSTHVLFEPMVSLQDELTREISRQLRPALVATCS
jgi:hypothetical protein